MGAKPSGAGRSYLSDLWAWPDPRLPHDVRDSAMRALCEAIAAQLPALCGGEAEHPLEMGLRLHDAVMRLALDDFEAEMPPLARAVCLSPFDAAIHDAVGHALGISAFAFYNEPVAVPTADAGFPEEGAIPAIAAALSLPTARSPHGWWSGPGREQRLTSRPGSGTEATMRSN